MLLALVFEFVCTCVCGFSFGNVPPASPLMLKFANAKIPSLRAGMAAVYDGDDSVYIMGGIDANRALQNQVLKYSLDTNTVAVVGTGPTISDGNLVMSPNGGNLLHIGGNTYDGQTTDVYQFSLANKTTVVVGQIPDKHDRHAFGWDRQNGDAYMFGGIAIDRGTLGDNSDDVIAYNVTSGEIEIVGHLPEARAFSTSAWGANGVAYILGGYGDHGKGDLSHDILSFDSRTGHVSKLSTKLVDSVNSGAAVFDEVNNVIYFQRPYRLMRFSPTDQSVDEAKVDGWPQYFARTAGVYVPKQRRAYFFGGFAEFNGETNRSEDRISDKIMYIELGPDYGSSELGPRGECETRCRDACGAAESE